MVTVSRFVRLASFVLLVVPTAGCQSKTDTDKVVDSWLSPNHVEVRMVINNLGSSNPDYTCRDDVSYSVETIDSDGVDLQGTEYRANKEFKIIVRAGDFDVHWEVNGSSWSPWRSYSTSDKQPIQLACLGKGI